MDLLIDLLLAAVELMAGISADSSAAGAQELFESEESRRRALDIVALVVSAALCGWLTTIPFSHRLSPCPPVPGVSLFLAPFIVGLGTRWWGQRRARSNHRTTLIATFGGGAAFGFISAAIRLLVLP